MAGGDGGLTWGWRGGNRAEKHNEVTPHHQRALPSSGGKLYVPSEVLTFQAAPKLEKEN